MNKSEISKQLTIMFSKKGQLEFMFAGEFNGKDITAIINNVRKGYLKFQKNKADSLLKIKRKDEKVRLEDLNRQAKEYLKPENHSRINGLKITNKELYDKVISLLHDKMNDKTEGEPQGGITK